jgi:hypothetical protein
LKGTRDGMRGGKSTYPAFKAFCAADFVGFQAFDEF